MNRIPHLSEYVTSKGFLEFLQLSKEDAESIQYNFLAQGEYNCNYDFIHPVTKKHLVLRINFGSQMHLPKQITYEYNALSLLKNSSRTPEAYYLDDSKQFLPNGVLVMEYINGRPLDYEKDLAAAAACLADIHSLFIPPENSLISVRKPLQAILLECEQMFSVYESSPLAESAKIKWIRKLLEKGEKRIHALDMSNPYLCCINTELNNTNFLVEENGFARLVDWEKPLLGDPAQDLGHFLAPTTTFWKTDIIFDRAQTDAFIDSYIQQAANRYPVYNLRERVGAYIPITCLRGITWCAMAWVEYQQPDRALRNESTWKKLSQYLSEEYLGMVEDRLLE